MQSATKHASDCQRVFKNYDSNCPRCKELIAGAAPREGWQTKYFQKKKQDDEQRARAIHEHFAPGGPHAQGKCGPVCTAFDW